MFIYKKTKLNFLSFNLWLYKKLKMQHNIILKLTKIIKLNEFETINFNELVVLKKTVLYKKKLKFFLVHYKQL